MKDPLLFNLEKIENIPIPVIQKSVAESSGVTIENMLLSNKDPLSRKREIVTARQISMVLSKKYTKHSLAYIGYKHGKHDHSTVLHAVKTINNLIDVNTFEVIEIFNKSDNKIKEWHKEATCLFYINNQKRFSLIKFWIKNKIPLEIRAEIFKYGGYKCKHCGNFKRWNDIFKLK